MSDIATRIDGQRRCVREHIEKYNVYKQFPSGWDGKKALDTIVSAQNHIAELKGKGRVADSWEDNWRP